MKCQYNAICRDIVCDKCSKTFKHESSLSRHKSTCTRSGTTSSTSADILSTMLENQSKLLQEIQKLQSNQLVITATPPPSTNQTITQNVTNNITYNIASFGCEDIRHIEESKDFLTKCIVEKNLVDIIEKIHFDKDYPQNQNVRMKSFKHDLMETNTDGRWIITDKNETYDRLVNKGATIMKLHTKRNKQTIIDECEEEGEDFEDITHFLFKMGQCNFYH